MIEVRLHGRGGQGAVTAAYVLAAAAFEEGKWSQAFPMFGVERRGAPVQAFVRIDTTPVRVRTQIYTPDYVLVLDPTLTQNVDVSLGAKKMIIINSGKPASSFKFKVPTKTIDVSKVALEILGRDITNTGILAAFAATTGIVGLKSLEEAIRKTMRADLVDKNITLVRRVYELGKKK